MVGRRYYNLEWGRCISPDSIEYLDPTSINGLNLYAYCGNDPVNYTDRSGHGPDSVWKTLFGVAAGLGYGAGKFMSKYIFKNNGFTFTDYYETALLDFSKKTAFLIAAGTVGYTFLPTIATGIARGVSNFIGNRIGDRF